MIRTTRLSGNAAKLVEYMQDKLFEREITRGEHKGEKLVEGYYSNKGAPSQWFGRGAEAQGLRGAVDSQDMQAALSGIVKSTGEDLSKRGGQTAETRRLGEDWTISAPKSVSVMSVEDPRIAEAHTSAARAALSYIESEMAYGRMGKGGEKGNDFAGNITAALYLHEDSRPDSETGRVSPHLHTHALICNMIQRSDGSWGSMKIDWGHHNEKKMTADAVYKSALASELQKLGYEIEKGRGADFEIKGITREQIEHFSPRSEAIKKEIGGERDSVSAAAREAAQNKTRQQKSALSQVEQRFQWRQEIRDQGMDLSTIRKSADQRAARSEVSSKVTADLALQSALHHLSERDTTFSEHQLRQEALSAGLGDVSPEQIEQAISERKAGLVAAGEGKGLKTTNFTTKSAVLRESAILARAGAGKGKSEPIFSKDATDSTVVPAVSFTEQEIKDGKRSFKQRAVSYIAQAVSLTKHVLQHMSEQSLDADEKRQNSDLLPGHARADRSGDGDLRRDADRPEQPRVAAVEAVIKEREVRQGFAFSHGQADGVRLALTSTDQHIGIVGAAGAGKTTSMACIVEQFQKAGYEVIGVAPSAAAAHELRDAGCDETKTLASLLREKPKAGDEGKKKLYVLDEAGMVSSKDYDAFYKNADRERARTLSVGDPLQLQSVEAGSAFKQLLDSGSIDHVKIDEIQRQKKDPQLKELAQAFAAGDAAKGVELAKPYMTQVQPTKQDFAEASVEMKSAPPDAEKAPAAVRQIALARAGADAYLSLSKEERSKTLLLAGTNKTRQMINEKIREGLIDEGTLGDRATTITALDKMDLTREQATQAENYSSKDGQRVIVQFGSEYKEKDSSGNRQTLASKGSQFEVIGIANGKLKLQSIYDPEKQIEVNPAKIKGLQAFSVRDMELRDGDQIMFRQNDKAKGVINGMQGVVSLDENGAVKVKTASGQEIPLAINSGHVIDYSYAKTVHSSQGATVERAIVVGEGGRVATAESAYVACSREKTGLQIITDDTEKLSKSWERFSDRQHAKDAARESFQAPDSLQEIQLERARAGIEAGDLGDLALARAGGVQAAVDQAREEQEQQGQQQGGSETRSPEQHGNGEKEGEEGQEAEAEQVEGPEIEMEISM